MSRATLSDTLTALALGADPGHEFLAVEEARISLPMIVRMERGPDGPVFFAQPPWSAFRSGVEPVAHRARLVFGQVPNHDQAARAAPARPAPDHSANPATRPATDPKG